MNIWTNVCCILILIIIPLISAFTGSRSTRYYDPCSVQKSEAGLTWSVLTHRSRSTCLFAGDKIQNKKGSSPSQNKRRNYVNNRTQNEGDGAMQQYRTINSEIIRSKSVDDILNVFVKHGGLRTQCFNAVNFSTAVHRLAKLSSRNKQSKIDLAEDVRFGYLVSRLALYLIESPELFQNREISNILWAIAKLNLRSSKNAASEPPNMQSEERLSKAANLGIQSIETVIRTRDRSNISKISELVGLIMIGIGERLLLELSQSSKLMKNATPQELANIIWSLATLQRSSQLIVSLVDRLLELGESGRSIFQSDDDNSSRKSESNPSLLVKPQEMSNTLWSLAKLSSTSSDELSPNFERLLTYLHTISGGDSGKVNIENLDKFKPQELANTIWALATLVQQEQINPIIYPRLTKIITLWMMYLNIEKQDTKQPFKPQEISNIVWGLANLEMFLDGINPELTEEFLINFIRRIDLEVFPPQELNNAVWGVAKLCKMIDCVVNWDKNTKSELEKSVSDLILKAEQVIENRQCRYFMPQDISTVSYSAAYLGYPIDRKLYTILIDQFVRNSKYYKPQETSNIAWSLTTAGYDHDENKSELFRLAFEIIAKKLQTRPQFFKAQEQKDILWSHSKSGIINHELFYNMCEYWTKLGNMNNFACQSLGGVAWSISKQCSPFISSSRDMTNGKQAVYVNLYKSLFRSDARLMHDCLRMILEESISKLSQFTTRDLNNLAYSIAILGVAYTPLMRSLFRELLKRIKESLDDPKSMLEGSEVAVIVWSLAVLNLGPIMSEKDRSDLTYCIEGLMDAEMYFQDFELLNLTWGAVVLGTYPIKLLKRMLFVFDDSRAKGVWEPQQDGAMLYIQTLCQLDPVCNNIFEFPTIVTGLYDDDDDDDDDQADNEQTQQPSHLQSSRFQASVYETVREIMPTSAGAVDVREEYAIQCLYVDIAIPDHHLCIECDGPSHYCIPLHEDLSLELKEDELNNNPALWSLRKDWNNGSTALKDRMLKLMGWRVVHVPYWEWNQARRNGSDDKGEYLKNLLFSQLEI